MLARSPPTLPADAPLPPPALPLPFHAGTGWGRGLGPEERFEAAAAINAQRVRQGVTAFQAGPVRGLGCSSSQGPGRCHAGVRCAMVAELPHKAGQPPTPGRRAPLLPQEAALDSVAEHVDMACLHKLRLGLAAAVKDRSNATTSSVTKFVSGPVRPPAAAAARRPCCRGAA